MGLILPDFPNLSVIKTSDYFDQGKMPERSIGTVSKTVVPSGTQGSNPCLSANYHHESAANQAFAADFIFDTYKNPYKLQTKPNPIQCGRYHRNSTPRTKVSCNVRRENKVSRYFSNDNRRADFIYRLCPPHRIFRLMPIYPVCSAFIIRQCCHGTFSRSILGHLLLSGMFSPCHFCRVWT